MNKNPKYRDEEWYSEYLDDFGIYEGPAMACDPLGNPYVLFKYTVLLDVKEHMAQCVKEYMHGVSMNSDDPLWICLRRIPTFTKDEENGKEYFSVRLTIHKTPTIKKGWVQNEST